MKRKKKRRKESVGEHCRRPRRIDKPAFSTTNNHDKPVTTSPQLSPIRWRLLRPALRRSARPRQRCSGEMVVSTVLTASCYQLMHRHALSAHASAS